MAIRYVQKNESKKWIITNKKENGKPLHVLGTKREALEVAKSMKNTEAVMVKSPSGWKTEKQNETTSKVISTPVDKIQKENIKESTQMNDTSKTVEQPTQRVVDAAKMVEKTEKKKVNKMKETQETQENIIKDPVERIESINKNANHPTQLIRLKEEALALNEFAGTVKDINQPTRAVGTSDGKKEEKVIFKNEINKAVNVSLSADEKNIKKEMQYSGKKAKQYPPRIRVGIPAWAGVLIAIIILGIFVGAIFLVGQYI